MKQVIERAIKKLILYVILFLVLIFTVATTFQYRFQKKCKTTMQDCSNMSLLINDTQKRLEILISDVYATIKVMNYVDSIKTDISSVIEKYNSDLSDSLRFIIVHEIYTLSHKYDLSTNLLCAIITHESALTWDPQIESPVGAIGLMQVMPATGEEEAAEINIEWTSAKDILCNPILNLRIGTHYLSKLIKKHGLKGGLAAYNAGEKWVYIWKRNNKNNKYLPKETQGYIPAVLKLYDEFQYSINIGS